MVRLAAYQPDIPQNTGALMRLCAGFDVSLDLIEPFGFLWDERKIRIAAMDYYDYVKIRRYPSWEKFLSDKGLGRLVLLTTGGVTPYIEYQFRSDDILLLGRESAGVPEEVHAAADARLTIPMRRGIRSFNVAMAGAIVLAEALRQTGAWPQ